MVEALDAPAPGAGSGRAVPRAVVTELPARPLRRDDATRVRAATLGLAARFAGPADSAGEWQVDLPGTAHLTLKVADGRCAVVPGRAADPDVVLTTDADTWVDLAEGRTTGVRAFLSGALRVTGDLHRAVRLEALFRPVGPAHAVVRAERTRVGGLELASLAVGDGSPVVLLHGLAANSLSFLPTFDALSDRHEVHVLDLPGFGRSDKPLPTGRRYHPAWMAEQVRRYLVEHRLGPVHVVGNSMGGRVALELGLRHPEVVRSVTGLSPAVAFDGFQPLRPLIALTRTQWLGLAPLPLRTHHLERFVGEMFHDPGSVPRQNITAAASDATDMLRDRRYRMAVMAAARHLGAEPARGRRSFWNRLEGLVPPSLWLFGEQDRIVPVRYAERVAAALPHAQVEVWRALGHVPQFERPDETHELLGRFLARADARHDATR